jgi:hypothetical protein
MKAEILPPLGATLHVKPAGWRTGLRLWLPLFLLWLLLLPLVILALPFLLAAAIIFRIRFWRALAGAGGLLVALRGTRVDVNKADTNISIDLH